MEPDPAQSPPHAGSDAKVYFEHCVADAPRLRSDEAIFGSSFPVLEPSALQFGSFWVSKGDDRLSSELTTLWHRAAAEGAALAFRHDDSRESVARAVDEIVDHAGSSLLNLLVFYWSGSVAGSLVLRRETGVLPTNYGYVSRVVVRPDLQRRGLGTSLLEIAADKARRMALTRLTLTVHDESGLEKFYSRRGWVTVGAWERGIKFGDYDYKDEVVMQRLV